VSHLLIGKCCCLTDSCRRHAIGGSKGLGSHDHSSRELQEFLGDPGETVQDAEDDLAGSDLGVESVGKHPVNLPQPGPSSILLDLTSGVNGGGGAHHLVGVEDEVLRAPVPAEARKILRSLAVKEEEDVVSEYVQE